MTTKPGKVAHICNPGTWEVEAGMNQELKVTLCFMEASMSYVRCCIKRQESKTRQTKTKLIKATHFKAGKRLEYTLSKEDKQRAISTWKHVQHGQPQSKANSPGDATTG